MEKNTHADVPSVAPNVLPIRARRVLNIVGHYADPPFFSLPREIRDTIYTLLLEEPILWNKRHIPECDFFNEDGNYELSPAHCIYLPNLKIDFHTKGDVVMCRRLCAHRNGIALLQVNRQIYREASKIFWRRNTICFIGLGDLHVALQTANRPFQQRITHLAIDMYGNSVSEKAKRPFCNSLSLLHNLESLDIDITLLPPKLNAILNMPKLKSLTLSTKKVLRGYYDYGGEIEGFYQVHAVLNRTFDLPDRETHKVKEKLGCPYSETPYTKDWCAECISWYDTILAQALQWTQRDDRTLIEPMDLARRALNRKEHFQPTDEPIKLKVKLQDGTFETLTIRGAARISRNDCIRGMNRYFREQLPRGKPQRTQYAVIEDYDDAGDEVLDNRPLQPRRKFAIAEEEKDKQAVLQERAEKRERNLAVDGIVERSRARSVAKARAKSESALQAEKKASRRRSPRPPEAR